ncbi:unnamed protein product [Ambrosiozyma monospora]|uniref:Unnamed protein product n=1 Tax=Ambrosiozyma monospora TaxID=43982 RepID=A0ACB5TBK3_AMBMO|nr:unnamed protein product [Ambrosiozyma monospora]
MGKKKTTLTTYDEPPILELDFGTDPLFSTNFHPTESIFVTGSATGYVKLFNYDAKSLETKVKNLNETQKKNKGWLRAKVGSKTLSFYGDEDQDEEIDKGLLSVGWKTKRHKGSCRSIVFDQTGETVISAGLDKELKLADTKTGQQEQKMENYYAMIPERSKRGKNQSTI